MVLATTGRCDLREPGLDVRAVGERGLKELEQWCDVLRAPGVEGLREPAALVDAEGQAALVDHGDPAGAVAEAHLLVVHHLLVDVGDHLQPGGAVEEPAQRPRPRGEVAAVGDELGVAREPERPDPALVEEQCGKLASFYERNGRPIRESMPLADFLVRRGRVLAAALRG